MDEYDPQPTRRTLSPVARLLIWIPALAVAFYLGVTWRTGNAGQRGAAAPRATSDGVLQDSELATIALFRDASPSVVFITTLSRQRIPFSRQTAEVPSGSGSGFIWDGQGHIVTNYHVIATASAARVTLADQSEWDAKVVGWAEEKDLAVLEIDAPAELLQPIPVGGSKGLQVGQMVLAIGNPFGLDHTLTTGVISALGREILSLDRKPIRDVIQTDAAINPGNSGGPLLDSSGRLIGVNTQIFSPSGASAGIGFAIPVDTVNWVVPDLIQYGEIRRPALGISGFSVTYLPRGAKERLRAVLVQEIIPGLGAAEARLRAQGAMRGDQIGDLIVGIAGEKVENMDDLMLALEKYRDGDTVTVTVLRDDKPAEVPVRLSMNAPRRR